MVPPVCPASCLQTCAHPYMRLSCQHPSSMISSRYEKIALADLPPATPSPGGRQVVLCLLRFAQRESRGFLHAKGGSLVAKTYQGRVWHEDLRGAKKAPLGPFSLPFPKTPRLGERATRPVRRTDVLWFCQDTRFISACEAIRTNCVITPAKTRNRSWRLTLQRAKATPVGGALYARLWIHLAYPARARILECWARIIGIARLRFITHGHALFNARKRREPLLEVFEILGS